MHNLIFKISSFIFGTFESLRLLIVKLSFSQATTISKKIDFIIYDKLIIKAKSFERQNDYGREYNFSNRLF